MIRGGSLAGTRGRIVELIRRSNQTASDIAAELGLTYNAVRMHLTALERDAVIRRAGPRRGGTRPAMTYELAPGVEDILSRAYMPFASHLIRALGNRFSDEELADLMRDVGRSLATEWPITRGTLDQRVAAASAILQELGAPNDGETDADVVRIRGHSCLLAAAVREQPHVCHAMETLLRELIAAPVRECCDRGADPRCRFEIFRREPAGESDDMGTSREKGTRLAR